jgi:hypothetical protein
MDKSFYKKEVASLQDLFEKIKFTSDPNDANPLKQNQNNKNDMEMGESDLLSKGVLIIGILLMILVIGMVAFLTIWLMN